MASLIEIEFFDPGMSTGYVGGILKPDEPFIVRKVAQIPGGQDGLKRWLAVNDKLVNRPHSIHGCEKFIPMNKSGMTHTLESTYPLTIEGMLVDIGYITPYPEGAWQTPDRQNFAGDRTETNKTMRAARYWVSPNDVGQPDANDANSAMRHALYYVTRVLRHEPTLGALFG